MKNSQNQNTSKVQKDEVQRKSSIIFIQLGLIFSLLMVYWAIEAKTAYVTEILTDNRFNGSEDEIDIPEVPIDEPKQEEPIPAPEPDLSQLKSIKDDLPDFQGDLGTTEVEPTEKINLVQRVDQIVEVKIIDKPIEDFIQVERVPAFPGCTGTNEELKKCFSKKVSEFVNNKFDTSVSEGLDLEGKQRIFVQFVVDHMGNIAEIKVRAPHKRLENEARRVVSLLPVMKPAQQQSKNIGVRYNLPIVFEIQE